MKVSAITNNGDWTFGSGLAGYKKKSSAIRQNIATRLRSFKNDYFLDVNAGTDWLSILSTPNNKLTLERAVRSVVITTEGVLSVDSVSIIVSDRVAKVEVTYTDIYELQIVITERIQA